MRNNNESLPPGIRAVHSAQYVDMIKDSKLRAEIEDVEWTANNSSRAFGDALWFITVKFRWPIIIGIATCIAVYLYKN